VSDDEHEALVGHLLDGRYQLEALIGAGGMGAVFRARHVAMDRRVAVKVLRPHLVGDVTAARRFAREARGTFRVESEHAVKVLDFAVANDGMLYMVMEYLDGRTVGAELEVDGALEPRRALRIVAQVCEALAAAHRLGLVHRDIKPDNVMLVRRGGDPDFVKVLDFGLAKLMEDAAPGVFSHASLTQGDLIFGTPAYMSPEQAMGQPLDGRSDLYAVGATLFEMLTTGTPFAESGAMAMLARHVQTPAPHLAEVRPRLLEQPGYVALDALVQRCLAKDRDARPASAEALAADVSEVEAELGRSVSADAWPTAPRVAPDLASSRTAELDALATPLPLPLPLPVSETLRPSRRRWPAIAGFSVLAAAGLVVAIAISGSRTPPTSGVRSAAAPAPLVAAQPVAQPPAAEPPVAPAPPTPASISPSTSPSAPQPTRRQGQGQGQGGAEIAIHLRAAEQARTAGNHLRQLAEADAAHQLDPRNLRARYLLGDALLATGDTANGCRYLRSARRLAEARKALAGCPAD